MLHRSSIISISKLQSFRSIWKNVCFLSRNSSSAVRLDISGIYPPIATPFNADETIAYDKLAENFSKWNTIPFKGYVVLGSNGEFNYMNTDEKLVLVQEAKRLADSGKLLIAGAGCESTRETVELCSAMAKHGADAVLVYNPFYYKSRMTGHALLSHFTKVSDECPVPVILYNVPKFTGLHIPVDVVVKLSKHPNIIGLKDSSGDISRIADISYQTMSEDFQILAGSADFLLAAYNVGSVGGVCALANVLGEDVCRLAELASNRDLQSARELQLRLIGPNNCVTAKYGVPGLKTAMQWFGYYGGPPRLPMTSLTQNEVDAMKKEFQNSAYLTD